jgi:hypothetical protein
MAFDVRPLSFLVLLLSLCVSAQGGPYEWLAKQWTSLTRKVEGDTCGARDHTPTCSHRPTCTARLPFANRCAYDHSRLRSVKSEFESRLCSQVRVGCYVVWSHRSRSMR